MNITRETVEHIAALSRLRLSERESGQIAAQLEQIVGYMDILSRLSAEDAEPVGHGIPLKNVLRADEALPSRPREQLLANSPSHDGEAFLVPRTVE